MKKDPSTFALRLDGKPLEENESLESTVGASNFGEMQTQLEDAKRLIPIPDSSRYESCELIAHGGTGLVFRAKDQELPRDVALKVLKEEFQDNHQASQIFIDEAAIIGYLSHPGIPPIYDMGHCADGRPYFAMKYIEGQTLARKMRSNDLNSFELFSIFSNVCQTMAFAHSCGVIHLDLKPANIMVGSFGNVLVMDWGFARFVAAPPQRVKKFVMQANMALGVCGTPGYMAPEQARGEELDERADVFGLGAILFEILTGKRLQQSKSKKKLAQWPSSAELDWILQELDECRSDCSLIRLVRNCLSVKRNHRPGNAIEVAHEVASFQASALEQARDDLKRFFEVSLDLFCIANFDGYFRRINSNFTNVLGYSERELLEKPFVEFVHPEDRESTNRQMSVLLHGQPVVRFRNRYRTADGSYITMEWTAKAIAEENMIFAVARDVTSPHHDAS